MAAESYFQLTLIDQSEYAISKRGPLYMGG